MTKARTVPGESISSRLTARGASHAHVGPQRSFFQRLGVADPYGEDPEAEEAARSGLFSYISASNYYRDLRAHRLRMMWRLGAIRHRPVSGERLRAAGPSFSAASTLKRAALPTTSELVFIDSDAAADEEEEGTGLFRRSRRSETPRRRSRAATRAAERSVGRSDRELAQALAQIESLLDAGPARSEVERAAREIPGLPAARKAERVREVVRTVERVRERKAPPRVERGQRPAAVAAQRMQAFQQVAERVEQRLPASATRGRRGPAGLEPVLRSSPAIRAVAAADSRTGRRPEAVDRLAGEVRRTARTTRNALRAPEQVGLEPVAPEAPPPIRPVRARSAAPRSEGRARPRPTEPAPEASTARLARTLSSQVLAPLHTPEAVDLGRGLEAAGRPSPRVRRAASEPSPLVRAVSRERAGASPAGVATPLSGASTSWLADVLEPERRVRRARRQAPEVRSLAVARDLEVLEQPEAIPDEPARRPARRAEPAPERRSRTVRSSEGPTEAASTSARTRRSESRPSTLRAIDRSLPADDESLAPRPVRRSRRRPVPRRPEAPVLLAPEGAEEAPSATRRVATAAPEERPAALRPRRSEAPRRAERAAVRASRRLDLQEPERRATAPLLDRVTPTTEAEEPARRRAMVRSATRPASVDMVALNVEAESEEVAALPGRPRRSAAQPAPVRPARVSEEEVPGAEGPARTVRSRDVETPRIGVTRTAREAVADDATPSTGPTSRRTAVTPGEAPVLARPVGAEVEASPEGPTPLRRARVPAARPPATRRAAHRAAEPRAVSTRRRTPLAAPPTAFVDPVAVEKATSRQEASLSAGRRPARRGEDRPSTRALSRPVRVARVDERDRAQLLPGPTDYLDVAAAAEAPFRSPVRRVRPSVSMPERSLLTTADAPEGEDSSLAGSLRRVATELAADRGRGPARRLSLTEDEDVAVRPATSRRARPVLPVQQLALPSLTDGDDAPDVAAPLATRRTELPALSRSLRQVVSSFRAAERDDVQVVTLDAARRAVEPARAGRRPTTTAVLERDDEGRLVRARARRSPSIGPVESIVLDQADLGEPTSSAPVARRSTRRLDEADARQPATRPLRAAPQATVLAQSPASWAEARGEVGEGTPRRRTPGVRRVPSPAARATRRMARPIPEGPMPRGDGRPSLAPAHRLTAPTAPRPERRTPDLGLATLEPAAEIEEEGSERLPAHRAGRRSHSANTWAEVAQRADRRGRAVGRTGRRSRRGAGLAEDAPGWVRRAVESPVEHSERDAPGSRVRAGGGLLTALARAADPEEIVRVIVQRSHEAGTLARELPSATGKLIQEVAEHGANLIGGDTGITSRAQRGQTVASGTSKRARQAWLDASDSAPSRGFRTRSGRTEGSQGNEGVGASNVMKLAGKLQKLIHLAEHQRRLDEARAAVRMAEESAEARAEVGAGHSGSQQLEQDNMHRERLIGEIIEAVQDRKRIREMMMGDEDGGW